MSPRPPIPPCRTGALVPVLVIGLLLALLVPGRAWASGPRGPSLEPPGLDLGLAPPLAPELAAPPPSGAPPSGGPGATIPVKPTPTVAEPTSEDPSEP